MFGQVETLEKENRAHVAHIAALSKHPTCKNAHGHCVSCHDDDDRGIEEVVCCRELDEAERKVDALTKERDEHSCFDQIAERLRDSGLCGLSHESGVTVIKTEDADALNGARDKALEEAVQIVHPRPHEPPHVVHILSRRQDEIRALKSQPTRDGGGE